MATVSLPLLPLSPARARWDWLELALDYRCNLRCLGCHACEDTGASLTTEAAIQLLRAGRQGGCSRLWLGGGEPTLRPDLLRLVHAARALGYGEVLLQTNGMRLSYAAYRKAVIAAGVTEVRVNVKSHRADVHDRLSRGECHALLLAALEGLVAERVSLSADFLLTRTTAPDLPDAVSFYSARGVRRFVLWLLSASDVADDEVDSEVPRLSDLVPYLGAAAERAREAGIGLQSLHTPPCTLPVELRSLFTPASSFGLVVAGPDGQTFPLESSAFEGGAFLEGCGRCLARPSCGGPRADYLRIHGAADFVPVMEHLDPGR